MPALHSHTHCQAAQSSRTSQSLSKSVPALPHGRKRKHGHTTWYIKNWAISGKFQGFVSHQSFGFGGQVIASKCPTFHIPEPLRIDYQNLKTGVRHQYWLTTSTPILKIA